MRDSQIRSFAEGSDSENERELLAEFARMRELIAHRVRTVALKHQTGAYLVGRPGAGKTEAVREALDSGGFSYVFENARMTPAALFDLIEERPDDVIVLDDIPSLFKNPQAVQILLAALGGRPGVPRRVSYSTKGKRRFVDFNGGIIAISNIRLGHSEHDEALISRTSKLDHEPTDDMLASFIREMSRKGYRDVPPNESVAVAEFVLEECKTGDYRIDLRYYLKGIEDYSYSTGRNDPDIWKDLIRSTMRKILADPGSYSRAAQVGREREIARELEARKLPRAEREAEWKRLTGKSKDSYYRRIKEANAG